MFKFWASILKEFRLLIRDKVGLALMFIMPITLVIIITNIQNNAFDFIKNKGVNVIVCNNDSGNVSKDFISSLQKTEMFNVINIKKRVCNTEIKKYNALVAIEIPQNYSRQIKNKIKKISNKALINFGLNNDSTIANENILADSIAITFNRTLQNNYRYAINSALQSAMFITENRLLIKELYFEINGKEISESFEKEIINDGNVFKEKFTIKDKNKIPNATQHNIPSWTVFAMFFMIISLGGNIVREKLSGNFIRIKILPASYFVSLISKQIIYLLVVVVLVITIFSIGIWIFPLINLPALNMPNNILGLFLVSTVCGLTAISYALCIGVFANTQEQSSGFGAVSIVILAVIGGVFVPPFAMPDSFHLITKFSPFYWSLQAYYDLFLENSKFIDVLINILPLLINIVIFQLIAFIGLKRKNLI